MFPNLLHNLCVLSSNSLAHGGHWTDLFVWLLVQAHVRVSVKRVGGSYLPCPLSPQRMLFEKLVLLAAATDLLERVKLFSGF